MERLDCPAIIMLTHVPMSVALFELLGPSAGKRVLDLACGHGRISRELARRGARVVGVDLSGALLDRACFPRCGFTALPPRTPQGVVCARVRAARARRAHRARHRAVGLWQKPA